MKKFLNSAFAVYQNYSDLSQLNNFEYPAQPHLIIVKYPTSSERIRLQNTYYYIDCHRILNIL